MAALALPLPLPLPDALVAQGVALRREGPGDKGFAAALYAANRMAELALVPWPREAKDAFLAEQFALQWRHFGKNWPRADRWIVTRGGADLGRIYWVRTRPVWEFIEIGLLPAAQGSGIGAALVGWLQALAQAGGAKGLLLHVAHDNPRAAALYARLGFVDVDSPNPAHAATHRAMRWAAG